MENMVTELDFDDFYSNKKVLITGHTGFKGSWLAIWLQKMGAEVIGYSLPPKTDPNLFTVANVENGMTSLFGDIRDLSKISKVISEYKPTIVFHMAAQALVRESYNEPVETFETNVMGTVNVLEAVRNSKSVVSCLIVTSDKCYENREWERGYREDDAMGGNEPYSASKGCAELVVAAFRKSFFEKNNNTAVASVRAGNVIGGGDWATDRLVPDIMRTISNGSSLKLRYPNSYRPWQHVLDPLSGYLVLAKKLYIDRDEVAEAWNFGPDEDQVITVSDLVYKISEYMGADLTIKEEQSELEEMMRLKLDSSKAHRHLGWKPRLSIDNAIRYTADWFAAYFRNSLAAQSLVNEQINSFMDD